MKYWFSYFIFVCPVFWFDFQRIFGCLIIKLLANLAV